MLPQLRREVERLVTRRAIGIMGKVPSPGAVKTRLCPPLRPDEAAVLYRAFLRDSILLALDVPDANVVVICPPGDIPAELRELAPAGVEFVVQTGAGLGAGLRESAVALLNGSAEFVLLVSSDTPTLPSNYLTRAFELLESGAAEVVLGPCDDGGYYLIGVRADHPRLYEDIDWSTVRVTAQTLERAHELGLCVELLPGWYDIDDGASLERLVDDLGRDGMLGAPATRVALQSLRRWGARLPSPSIPWRIRDRRVEFESPWRTFNTDLVTTHTGAQIEYRYLTMPDAVWVVPVTTAGEMVLIRQYRHPIKDWALEVPAGSLDERPMAEVAASELREEVGGIAGELRYIGAFYSVSAHASLRGHVFLALDVELGDAELEPTELLVPQRVPAELAFDMARRGEINDGESALAVLYCERAVLEHLGRWRA